MKIVTLGSVAKFIRGVTFKPGEVVDAHCPEAVGVVRTKNVQRELDLRDVVYIPDDLVGREDQLIQRDDILVSSANSWNLVGKCCWVPRLADRYAIGGFITGLRVTSEEVHPRYLYLWLASQRVQAELRNTANQTTNIANLNLKRCEQLPLPLPPLDEQRRIAAILDKADDLRVARQQSRLQLEALGSSIFAEMFGSQECQTAQLCQVVRPGTIVTYGIVQAGPEYDGGVPYIRTGDIIDGAIRTTALRHTAPAIAAKFERSRIGVGDIVMSIRATVGTTALVPPELDGANLTQGTAKISPSDIATGPYLLHYLRSPGAQRWIQAQVKGATFREITLGALRQLPVPLAQLPLQKEFDHRLRVLIATRAHASASSDRVDELVASLQSRAFSGHL